MAGLHIYDGWQRGVDADERRCFLLFLAASAYLCLALSLPSLFFSLYPSTCGNKSTDVIVCNDFVLVSFKELQKCLGLTGEELQGLRNQMENYHRVALTDEPHVQFQVKELSIGDFLSCFDCQTLSVDTDRTTTICNIVISPTMSDAKKCKLGEAPSTLEATRHASREEMGAKSHFVACCVTRCLVCAVWTALLLLMVFSRLYFFLTCFKWFLMVLCNEANLVVLCCRRFLVQESSHDWVVNIV